MSKAATQPDTASQVPIADESHNSVRKACYGRSGLGRASEHGSRLGPRGPRGQLRHRLLEPEVVEADQRDRLLRATVSVVADRGYEQATMREVLWQAGVSRRTIYAHFGGVGDLLLTACQASLDFALGELEQAIAAQANSANGVRDGLRRLLEYWESEPELARCCLLEMYALGASGQDCRRRTLERLAAALRPTGLGGGAGRGGRLSLTDELVAGGIWHTIETAVAAHETPSLTSMLPAVHSHVLRYETRAQQPSGAAHRQPSTWRQR